MAIEQILGIVGGAASSSGAHHAHPPHTAFVQTFSHWATYNDPYPAYKAVEDAHEAISVAKQTATTADSG